jgi:hypothetical protein
VKRIRAKDRKEGQEKEKKKKKKQGTKTSHQHIDSESSSVALEYDCVDRVDHRLNTDVELSEARRKKNRERREEGVNERKQ